MACPSWRQVDTDERRPLMRRRSQRREPVSALRR